MGPLEAKSIAVLTLLAVLVFFPSDAGFAQTGSAALNGTVTDQSGAAISEVRITLTNINTGVRHSVRTGSAGVYSLTDIPPGNYTARAQRDGFATKEETGVVLQVNETATLY